MVKIYENISENFTILFFLLKKRPSSKKKITSTIMEKNKFFKRITLESKHKYTTEDSNTVHLKATTLATSSALQKNEIEHPLSPKPPLTPGTAKLP